VKGNVTFFFDVLALCNQVLVDIDPHTNLVSYKSTSPDDLALVNSALENAGI
jgi:magnesium-transporting ATPase (P-type)